MNPADNNQADSQYTVVARRYRPQSFGDLVGQNHIAQALGNAIAHNRVGHAYLFTGARGVGKTSSARIFAKCLNCETGPTSTPCNECDICQAVSNGEDVDVLEIDGASNRGIDEIRQLRSNANVRPSRSRNKIYIIDEVHMLTQQAFNALLKTLEEPPKHVKFVFCTTDPHKIPITVLSRCQRFDFSPVQTDEITKRLTEICENEGVKAEEEALKLLARRAGGSMRDSQSLLEQLFSFCGEDISVEEVHQLLGTADMGQICDLASAICDKQSAVGLNLIAKAIGDGVDSGQLTNQLLGLFRDTMAVRVGANSETLLYASDSDVEKLKAMAENLALEKLLSIVQILDQTIVRMQSSMHPRPLLEVAVVRISNLENLDTLADLISQLPAGGSAKSSPPKRPTGLAKKKHDGSVSTPSAAAEVSPVESNAATAATAVAGSAVAGVAASSFAQAKSELAKANKTPTEAAPVAGKPDATDSSAVELPSIELVPANLKKVWGQAVSTLGGLSAGLAARYTKIELPNSDCVVVTFGDKYSQDECNRPDRRKTLEGALQQIAGRTVKLEIRVDESELANAKAAKPRLTRIQMQRQIEQNPFVKSAIEVFDAEVVDFSAGRKDT